MHMCQQLTYNKSENIGKFLHDMSLEDYISYNMNLIKDNQVAIKHFNKSVEVHNGKIRTDWSNFKSFNHKMYFYCLKNHERLQVLGSHLKGFGCAICSGCITLSKEKVDILFKKLLNERIHCKIINELKGYETKIECICEKDYYIWYPTYNNLMKGSRCPKCANNVKPSYNDIVRLMHNIQTQNIETNILNNKITNNTIIECYCIEHSYKWESKYSNLKKKYNKKSRYCPMCSGYMKKSLGDINELIELLKLEKIKAILNGPINGSSKTKIDCECLIDGYKWTSTYNSLKNNKTRCAKCNGTAPTTEKNINNLIKKLKKDNIIIIKNDNKIYNKTKFNCECLIDGYKWISTYNSLKNGVRCFMCYKSGRTHELDHILPISCIRPLKCIGINKILKNTNLYELFQSSYNLNLITWQENQNKKDKIILGGIEYKNNDKILRGRNLFQSPKLLNYFCNLHFKEHYQKIMLVDYCYKIIKIIPEKINDIVQYEKELNELELSLNL